MFTHRRSFRIAALCCALFLSSAAALSAQTTTPDNSANNKGQGNTADQQSHAAGDRQITQKIRKAIIADKTLSVYGHNVKIITQNGAVTLKGPVHSDDEKQAIEKHAADVAGPDKVTDQLTVKQ